MAKGGRLFRTGQLVLVLKGGHLFCYLDVLKPQTVSLVIPALTDSVFTRQVTLAKKKWTSLCNLGLLASFCENRGRFENGRCITKTPPNVEFLTEWRFLKKGRNLRIFAILYKLSFVCCLHFRKVLEHVDTRIWQ